MDFKLFIKQKAEKYSKIKLLFSTSSHSRSTSRICFRTTFIFDIYVNDIAESVLSLTRLFADDSSLFLSGSSFILDDIEGIMNHDLRVVFSWASQWLVNFNPNKTEAMLFTLRNVDNLPSLIFINSLIQFVDHHKHLGVTFSCDGKWNKHVENILQSALKVIGIMRKLKYEFSRLALNQILYTSYVRAFIEYSSIVWDGCFEQNADLLEKLQYEAARIVTGLTRSVNLENLYKECGWPSLAIRRKYQKLNFM